MPEIKKGLLIVLSGPSGVGKGTICKELLSRNSRMDISISATTRLPRGSEVDGIDYFFKNVLQFEEMVKCDEFLEYTRVFGRDYYGTPRKYVLEELAKGKDILLDIDVQGAMNVKKAYEDAVLVFIAPPSMEELLTRLTGRGTESDEAISRRFRTAYQEIRMMDLYDYIVVNEQIEQAVKKIENIIEAEKAKPSRCMDLIKTLQEGN